MHPTLRFTRLDHLVLLYFINRILFGEQHISRSSLYVIFANLLPLNSQYQTLSQTTYNNIHGGAANEFKMLSAGFSTVCHFHNDVSMVRSMTYLNY
jgi:hypothetical protein